METPQPPPDLPEPPDRRAKLREYLEFSAVLAVAVTATGLLAAGFPPAAARGDFGTVARITLIALAAGLSVGLLWQLVRYARDAVRFGTLAGLHVTLVMGAVFGVVMTFYLWPAVAVVCSVVWTVGGGWARPERLLLGGGVGGGLGAFLVAVTFVTLRNKLTAARRAAEARAKL